MQTFLEKFSFLMQDFPVLLQKKQADDPKRIICDVLSVSSLEDSNREASRTRS